MVCLFGAKLYNKCKMQIGLESAHGCQKTIFMTGYLLLQLKVQNLR